MSVASIRTCLADAVGDIEEPAVGGRDEHNLEALGNRFSIIDFQVLPTGSQW